MSDTKTLVLNKAQCRNCGDVIESTHRHDFVGCTCYINSHKLLNDFPDDKQFVLTDDGTKNTTQYTDEYLAYIHSMHGIAIDGGKEYQKRTYYNSDDFLDLSEWSE